MELCFLGTGAGAPTLQRTVSSLALRLFDSQEIWLFDCGEGTQLQMQKAHLSLVKVRRIFITHLHGDHLFGLPGLLGSRSQQQAATEPLDLYGPPGLRAYVDMALQTAQTHLRYPLCTHELSVPDDLSDAPLSSVLQTDAFTVTAALLDHGITSLGYRIQERDRPGAFRAAQAKAFGIPPGPLYARLKRGEQITLPDGRTFSGQAFTEARVKGRILAIMGDTRPCDSAVKLASGADVLVHEGTLEAGEEELAHARYHSTVGDAVAAGTSAGVRTVIVTHLSARNKTTSAEMGPLPSPALSCANRPVTMIAQDLLRFALPIHKSE